MSGHYRTNAYFKLKFTKRRCFLYGVGTLFFIARTSPIHYAIQAIYSPLLILLTNWIRFIYLQHIQINAPNVSVRVFIRQFPIVFWYVIGCVGVCECGFGVLVTQPEPKCGDTSCIIDPSQTRMMLELWLKRMKIDGVSDSDNNKSLSKKFSKLKVTYRQKSCMQATWVGIGSSGVGFNGSLWIWLKGWFLVVMIMHEKYIENW